MRLVIYTKTGLTWTNDYMYVTLPYLYDQMVSFVYK